ncbi:DUF6915 family protein [Microbulbifer sp. SSSA002]|uniref:DUF6915 family protein n=1 Tax=unclassified Microbulbifer TaxID=2619833 RepID=UPI00403A5B89
MNPTKHCQISVRRWGGQEEDYLEIHSFIDHTKFICSDMRHRILHNMWAVHHLVVPIFGHTITNSDGKEVDVKDLCERDHLLVDYHNKFIPSLSDFVETIDESQLPNNFRKDIEELHSRLSSNEEVSRLLLSPLSASGRFKSLLITHNSWFINHILPMIFDTNPVLDDFSINPSTFFNAMQPELWMDNGISYPPSFKNLSKKII